LLLWSTHSPQLVLISYKIFSLIAALYFFNAPAIYAASGIDSLKLKQEGVHIISEKDNITIHGSSNILIQFNKTVRYKLWNGNGVGKISNYSLPEIRDPTFIRHAAEKRNLQELYSSIKVNRFSASKIVENEGKIPIPIIESVEEVKMDVGNRFDNLYRFNYQLQSLQAGDVIEIEYEYIIPFQENMLDFLSYRYFFNGKYFKEHFKLTVSHKKKVKVDIYSANKAEYDKTFIDKNIKVYQWERFNLPGNIHEVNSRPFMELPYLILGIQPLSLTYVIPNSTNEEYIPKYALFADFRENRHHNIIRSIDIGVKMKDYNLIDKFFREQTASNDYVRDTLQLGNLRKIKRIIADDFEFKENVDYFNQDIHERAKIGAHLKKGVLSEQSKHETYVALVRKMKLDYFTAYITDLRSGLTDDKFLKSMQYCDYAIAPILSNEKIHYILPKNQAFGFYLDEFPFYFENTLARLVHIGDYRARKEVISTELRQVRTPFSLPKDNRRSVNILAEVNLSSYAVNFEALIKLSGQYSTMTRGVYDNKGYFDPTINPLYFKKPLEVDSSVEVSHREWLFKSDIYPFKASHKMAYQSNQLLRIVNDTIQLPVRNLFDHILPRPNCQFKRTTTFYSDFAGTDTYNYLFEFNKKVALINEESVKISNEYAEYIFSIEQVSDQSIKLSTHLNKRQDKIPVNQFQQVCEIYDAIENSTDLTIKLIIADK